VISESDKIVADKIRNGEIKMPSVRNLTEGLYRALYGDDDKLWEDFNKNRGSNNAANQRKRRLNDIRAATLSRPQKKAIVRLLVSLLRSSDFMAVALSDADDFEVMKIANLIIK